MSGLQIGDAYVVPGVGLGRVTGFHGRYEGLRHWLYVVVRVAPTISALVPVYEGQVLQ